MVAPEVINHQHHILTQIQREKAVVQGNRLLGLEIQMEKRSVLNKQDEAPPPAYLAWGEDGSSSYVRPPSSTPPQIDDEDEDGDDTPPEFINPSSQPFSSLLSPLTWTQILIGIVLFLIWLGKPDPIPLTEDFQVEPIPVPTNPISVIDVENAKIDVDDKEDIPKEDVGNNYEAINKFLLKNWRQQFAENLKTHPDQSGGRPTATVDNMTMVEFTLPQLNNVVIHHHNIPNYTQLIDLFYLNPESMEKGKTSNTFRYSSRENGPTYEYQPLFPSRDPRVDPAFVEGLSLHFFHCYLRMKEEGVPELSPDLKLFFSTPNVNHGEWVQFYGPGNLFEADTPAGGKPTLPSWGELFNRKTHKIKKTSYDFLRKTNITSDFTIAIKWEKGMGRMKQN